MNLRILSRYGFAAQAFSDRLRQDNDMQAQPLIAQSQAVPDVSASACAKFSCDFGETVQ
jgi:hypothetical protein